MSMMDVAMEFKSVNATGTTSEGVEKKVSIHISPAVQYMIVAKGIDENEMLAKAINGIVNDLKEKEILLMNNDIMENIFISSLKSMMRKSVLYYIWISLITLLSAALCGVLFTIPMIYNVSQPIIYGLVGALVFGALIHYIYTHSNKIMQTMKVYNEFKRYLDEYNTMVKNDKYGVVRCGLIDGK